MRLLKKESLAESEEDLSQQEQCTREEVKATDELLQDAKLKLDNALESNTISKSSITAAKMVLETATTKQKEAIDKLDNRGSLSGQQLTSFWMRFCHQSKLFQGKNKSNRKRSKEGKKELMSNVISHAWIVFY